MLNCKLALAAAGMCGLVSAYGMAASPSPDQNFAMKAASGGLTEVQLGKMAADSASAQDVKDFGQRMVTDHSQANQELQQIAQQENLQLPAQPTGKDQAAVKRFGSLKGAAFDSAYTRDMLRDHQQDVADFQKEAQSGQDPALKAFAQKYLPTLQQHLQLAQAMTTKK